MRSQLFVLSVGFLIGCGGGSDKPKLPDAKVFMDAAIDAAPVCSVKCESNICDGMNGSPAPGTSDFPALVLGSEQMRVSGNWFYSPTMGGLMGRTIFSVGGSVNDVGGTRDIIIFDVVKPQPGNFPTNTAINFDPDPTAATPVAYALFFGDAVVVNDQIQSIAQLYYASNGSTTLTAIGETDGQQITGTITATNFREVDQMSGADVPGGCTASLGGLNYFLTQMAGAFQPTQPGEINGWKPLSADEWTAVRAKIDDLRARGVLPY